jgi:carbamoyl-phosphate synthase large subunit
MKIMKGIIPLPEFYLIKSFNQFKKAVLKLGYPARPVCFKPTVSHGSRGFRILDSKINRLDMLLNQKPTGIITTLEEISPILKKAKPFPELLVMEYLPGEEFSVDVLAKDGESLIVIPRSRDYIKMGISFEGTLKRNKGIIDYSKKIVERLKLNGNIGFQFKNNKKGIPILIECNPRIQGTIVINTFAGANLVYLAVKLALGEKIKIPKVKWGTKMIRYWEEIYKYPK